MTTRLFLFPDETSAASEVIEPAGPFLASLGVDYAREATVPLAPEATPEAVLTLHAELVAAVSRRHGYQSVDVVRLHPEHPQREAARARFLEEHTHDDDEMRFFAEGWGVFYLHLGRQVVALRCEAGDLLRVPAGTTHWFDMGTRPSFTAIRWFTRPEGWVAAFTGSGIASRFPDADQLAAR
jgi:1,2-dihydroxy-3-keto-5-methylthiopentene dioxygenase